MPHERGQRWFAAPGIKSECQIVEQLFVKRALEARESGKSTLIDTQMHGIKILVDAWHQPFGMGKFALTDVGSERIDII